MNTPTEMYEISDVSRLAYFTGSTEYSIRMSRLAVELEMKPKADLVGEDLAAFRAGREFLIFRIRELNGPIQGRGK